MGLKRCGARHPSVGEKIDLLPVPLVDDPPVLLRPVDRLSVEYLELRDSIQKHGLLNSLAVRQFAGRYQVVDGMHRITAVRDLQRQTVPCIIKQVTDAELLMLQLSANAVRVETRPVEFARQLRRILKAEPDLKIGQMAVRLDKSAAWIGQQLSLLDLCEADQQAVDRGEIGLANAYMLAKVPKLARADVREQAGQLSTKEFKAVAAGIIKQFTEQVRKGNLDKRFQARFEPQAYLRSLREVTGELERRAEGPRMVVQENSKTPLDGFYAALKWAANLDREGTLRQQEMYLAKLRNPEKENL